MSLHHTTTDYLSALQAEFTPLSKSIAESHWTASDLFLSGLLYRMLSKPVSPETNCIQLKLPGFALGPNFNEVLLYTLAVVKYEQNNQLAQKSTYSPTSGDIVYRKGDIYKVNGRRSANEWAINLLSPLQGERGTTVLAKFKEPVKLLSKEEYTYQPQATADRLNNYREFFRSKLSKDKLPLLYEFSTYSMVLAEGELWQINNCLPLRYINKNGEQTAHHLPIKPMIEACGDVVTAIEHILPGKYFDELVVVGASRYSNALNALMGKLNNGNVGRLILIGDEQFPDAKTWEITATEIQYLRKCSLPTLTIHKVPATTLVSLVEELEALLQKYKEQFSIDLRDCISWLRPYLGLAIPMGVERDGCLQYFQQQIENRFAESEWEDRWYEVKVYDPEEINGYTLPIQKLFNQIHNYFEKNNPKWNSLIEYCTQNGLHRSWITLGHEQQAKALEGHNVLHGVGSRRWHHQSIPTLAELAESPEKYIPPSTRGKLFLPEISKSFQSLNQLSLLTLPLVVLAYAGLEDEYPDYVLRSYLLAERAKISHSDRHLWTACRLETLPPPSLTFANAIRIEQLFTIDTSKPITPGEESSYEWIAQPCKIRFADKATYDTHLNRRVELLGEEGQRRIVAVGSLVPGDRIRYYQNTNAEAFEEVIRSLDTQGLYQKIEAASRTWREELYNLYLHHFYIDEDQLFQQLKNHGYSNSQQVLHNYLLPSNSTRFPNYNTLKAIHAISLQYKGVGTAFDLAYSEILSYKRKDKSLRQRVGRELGSELMIFENSDYTIKGTVLSLLTENLIYVLIESIQEKVVTSIENR